MAVTPQFDWAKFESPIAQTSLSPKQQALNATPVPQTPQPPRIPEINSFDWSKYETSPEPKEETTLEAGGRHIARTASRAAEALIGLPGDIRQAVAGVFGLDSSKIPFLGHLATSEDLKKHSETLTKGYTAAKGKGEEFSDAIIGDAATLMLPVKGKVPFVRSLGLALGGNLAAEGAEMLGAKEGAQTATKLGAMFILHGLRPKGVDKFVSSLYAKADTQLPKGAMADAKTLGPELKALDASIRRGGSSGADKTKALTKISEIRSKISKGKIPVEELSEFKKSLNLARSGIYGEFIADKPGMKSAKRNLDAVSKTINNALDKYGMDVNPEWYKTYSSANEGFAAIQQSKKVSGAIGDFIKYNPKTAVSGLLAEIFFMPKTALATIPAYGGLKGAELLYRIGKSSVLRRYYFDVIKAAMEEDAALISRSASKLDAALRKEEKEPKN